jgi:hypothetical protein
MGRAGKVDIWLAVTFAVIGAVIGGRFLLVHGSTGFYQTMMPATVMWACGHGLVDPTQIGPELQLFLEQTSRTFDCKFLSGVDHTRDAGSFFYAHFYLGLAAATCWRIFGVNYESLWPLVSTLYGGYALACFFLLRLFFERRGAVLVCLILTVSPVAISMLDHLRDFAKAPFMILILGLLVLAIREVRPSRLLLIVGLAGVLVGVGSGFRADVKLMFAVGLVVLSLGLNAPAIKRHMRLLAVVLFASIAFLFSLPSVLKGSSVAGGFFVLQGATEPFRKALGIDPVPYDLGHAYNDKVNISTVVADLRRQDPQAWAASETGKEIFESAALTRTNSYVISWLPIFVGDLATRAITSVSWIAAYYALFDPAHLALEPLPGYVSETVHVSAIAMPLVIGLGWLGFLALLFRVYLSSKKEVIFFGGTLLVMMAVPSLQFSIRHLFHLEIVYWLGLLSLVGFTISIYRVRERLRVFGAWASVAIIVLLETYVAALIFQDHFLKKGIQAILDAPRVRSQISEEKLADGRTVFMLPAPHDYADVLSSSGSFVVHTASERILIEIGGPECPAGEFAISLEYLYGANFNRVLNVSRPENGEERTLIIFPIYFTPEEHFTGIIVPAGRDKCIIDGVSRIKHASRLPSIFAAVLTPDWRTKRMFQLPGLPFH